MEKEDTQEIKYLFEDVPVSHFVAMILIMIVENFLSLLIMRPVFVDTNQPSTEVIPHELERAIDGIPEKTKNVDTQKETISQVERTQKIKANN